MRSLVKRLGMGLPDSEPNIHAPQKIPTQTLRSILGGPAGRKRKKTVKSQSESGEEAEKTNKRKRSETKEAGEGLDQ